MPYVLDTNMLLRRAQVHHLMHGAASTAINALLERREVLFLTPQVLMEFWSVATRPAEVNGLGLTPEQADRDVAGLESIFRLLPETPDVYAVWRRLVVENGVSGRQVHDAHLAASMLAHGVTHLLTFNDADFRRYGGIIAVHPSAAATTDDGR